MSRHVEALELALEVLEYIYEGANNQGPHTGISWRCVSNKAEPAITAVKEALADSALERMAQNERELGIQMEPPCKTGSQCTSKCQQCEQPAQQHDPVAYAVYHRMGGSKTLHWPEQHSEDGDHNEYRLVPLYTAPQPAQQEPAVWTATRLWNRKDTWTCPADIEKDLLDGRAPQPAQPSKPWVGLTDEEYKQAEAKVWAVVSMDDTEKEANREFYEAIEAKLREKNA